MQLDKNKILSSEYDKVLLSFYRVIINKFPLSNMDNLISQLNTIDITKNPSSIKEFIIKGIKDNPCGYYPESNKILLIKDNVKDYHLYHELFHMLSTYRSDNTIYSGFSQGNRKTYVTIGDGLNEGYTQLLKERYFGIDDNESYFYMLQKHIAKHLEIIVGRRTMEKLYVNADLEGLVNQLEKYCNKEVILRFVNDVDYINKNIKDEKLNDYVTLKLKDSLLFLLNSFIVKQSMLYNKALLDDKSYKENIEKYLELLVNPLYYKGKEYQALTYEDVEFILYSNNLLPSNSRH